MEDTDHGSVESDPRRVWSAEEVATFLRSLGTAECFSNYFTMNFFQTILRRVECRGRATFLRSLGTAECFSNYFTFHLPLLL
jgi:hypothetical protein